MADLQGLLDLADLAMARASGVIPEDRLRPLEEVCVRARTRAGFLGEALVVAFAGGTGGGKSSIVNALVGHQVVDTSVRRPTTETATAVVPTDAATDFTPLLDSLGVDVRVPIESLDDTVLVDLPDFDSTVESHRAIVDEVLPTVDAVIWVLDPEKYADPVVHREFLSELADHESQFVFVVNQVDRLGDAVEAVVDDLRAKLVEDGFAAPTVVTSVAAAHSGEAAIDVSSVAGAIATRFDLKTTAIAKLAIDLRRTANESWHSIVGSSSEVPDDQAAALAAATFVSLGVAAYELERGLDRGVERA